MLTLFGLPSVSQAFANTFVASVLVLLT